MTWDIAVTPVTQDIESDVDHDKDSKRISRDRREQEEQRRRCHGMDTSMYQVDTQFQNHMVRHTEKEMKIQACHDNNKENVSTKYEMDKQSNRGKRKQDDDKDDRKPQENQRQMSPKMTKIVKTVKKLINLTIPFYLIKILIGHTLYMVMSKKSFLMTCQIHLARQ